MLVDFALYTPMFVSLTWALILLITSRTYGARIFLSFFMFTVSAISLSNVVYYHHQKEIFFSFELIYIFGTLSMLPVYQCYIKSLTYQTKIGFNDMKSLYPALTILIATLGSYLLMNTEMRTLYINQYLFGNGSWYDAPLLIRIQLILHYIILLVFIIQIIYSIKRIKIFITEYHRNITNYYSNLENKILEWPVIILYSFAIMSLLSSFTYFLGRNYFDKSPIILFVVGIGFAIFLFYLGFLGFLQRNIVEIIETDTVDFFEIPQTLKIKIELHILFEEKQLYKNPNLKISDIATSLNTNRTYISKFINNEYTISFSMFVNQYRVEEAKQLLKNEENTNYSLDYIASLAGFGSLHSFIRVFKEITGTTPGRFKKNNLPKNRENLL